MDQQPTPAGSPPPDNTTPPTPPQQPTPASPPPAPQGYPTQYPVQPSGQKSKAPLVIGIVIGAVVLLGLIGLGIFALIAATSKPSSSSNTTPNSPTKQEDSEPSTKSALKAKDSWDFGAVCDGTPISNAAAYTSGSSAKIASFYQPVLNKAWTTISAGYGKSYYIKADTPVEDISVVTCIKPTSGKDAPGTECTSDKGDKITYRSVTYKVTFYEAKTAKKIKDGESMNITADQCPTYVTYDKTSMSAYATPDYDMLEARLDTFAQ